MTYVMSDIHGRMDRFDRILDMIDFSNKDDLYILGDVIDRGPDGIKLLQRIMRRKNMHMLLGNHEFMMMEALGFPYDNRSNSKNIFHLWYINGGEDTHTAWTKLSYTETEELQKFLLMLPLNINVFINDKQFKLVHAAPVDTYDNIPNKMTSVAYYAVWDRNGILNSIGNDQYVTIFGHTNSAVFSPTHNFGHIAYKGNIIAIDCGCAVTDDRIENSLGCLRLEDMKEFYAK